MINWRNLLHAVIIITIFLLLSRLIPSSNKVSGSVNYAPDGFKASIDVDLKGVVAETKQEGLYWVMIGNRRLPFSYDESRLPGGWKNTYPKDFIQAGDSIIKNANSDTFYVIRKDQRWQYFLPR